MYPSFSALLYGVEREDTYSTSLSKNFLWQKKVVIFEKYMDTTSQPGLKVRVLIPFRCDLGKNGKASLPLTLLRNMIVQEWLGVPI